ncbi:hypothetical protein BC793_111126 [Actinoplanes xinjiangensis]|uniref:PH (Pleckstrin Homology) domain-containing protein n=1 Tax=Actinoplanes xinjiangensis TaxID=512350 RepID=A0A316FA24_9ACTN|nr:hypothetical protein BC793_111126 [Actinoplanes xinjiangensis]GIF41513.1 hypothetical protein Axi01nite_58240 [Actinoplanes xinjiangensis]
MHGVESYLLPGERVLWEGAPMRHRLFRRTDVLLLPFSVVWCGFAIVWLVRALRSDGAGLFPLFGVPFVIVGVYLVAGRFLVRALASRRTVYTVTDGRVVVRGGPTGARLTTAYLRDLPPPVIAERPDGSGSLAFGGFPGIGDVFTGGAKRGWRGWSDEPSDTPILWEVPDVRRVRDCVAQAQRAG